MKISSMESWVYLDSISNFKREDEYILNALRINNFDELKI